MKKKLAMLLAATMLATLFSGCGVGGKEDKGDCRHCEKWNW